MNENMDEIMKNYVESSTSTEESTDEHDETSEEDYVESSETEYGSYVYSLMSCALFVWYFSLFA